MAAVIVVSKAAATESWPKMGPVVAATMATNENVGADGLDATVSNAL